VFSRARASRWATALAVGLAGLIGVGAVAAVAARSAASPFELVFRGKHEPMPTSDKYPLGLRNTGTFTSSAPFCSSGTAVDLDLVGPDSGNRAIRLYTCADGSGSLTIWVETPLLEHGSAADGGWHIVAGTGRYLDLRGKGTYRGEFVSGDPNIAESVVFRSTMRGFADADAIAPTVVVSSAKVTKLQRPAGAYSIRLALSIRDNVEGNAVAYTVTATSGGASLANRFGTTASGTVSMTLRVRPPSTRARTIVLRIRATDPVGNEGSVSRAVKLPR